ncbi:Peptidyl-prolyl cis-trans isomerase, FKBP-type domain-containing protein [Rozella allomycis CSF55]|uniref:peptidylprolyl isomerase n=1 Tax=Rozella allomycis (strain CSF55) TaxID=988480 RepID=A0A075AQZ2_ROZAC|nr:Peptidyl-prolyl cis-trans isomerase, FKBP-type domain-containing protein [Rozella allomycis CSF55]|eukprot:EPZ32706.1 Peptidyl-prolyl cis-trans isomerase, FKBP-type domain-containing protein [Rozella allomycis CSF55]
MPNDTIKVHYEGRIWHEKNEGEKFDSSYDRNEPFSFTLGKSQVIQGWDQGLLGMCVGEKRKLQIPSHLAYGTRGAGSKIPPNAALTFVVELLDIEEGMLSQKLDRLIIEEPDQITCAQKTMPGDTLYVYYEGKFYSEDNDGKVFETNYGKKPLEFVLQANPKQVIQGMDDGLTSMCVGTSRILHIPSSMAYGATGAGNDIPPNTDLTFKLLSLCAIATNGALGSGGIYFMISRSLGPSFGGSVGVLYSLANILTCALGIVGFGEILVAFFGSDAGLFASMLPNSALARFLYSLTMLLFCGCISLMGTNAFKVLSVTTFYLSILSIALGIAGLLAEKGIQVSMLSQNWNPAFQQLNGISFNFSVIFGILYSACAGIQTGPSMSGEVKRSYRLPLGLLTSFVYVLMIFVLVSLVLALSCTRAELDDQFYLLISHAIWTPLIMLTLLLIVITTTISSILSAASTFTAMTNDGVLPLKFKWRRLSKDNFFIVLSCIASILISTFTSIDTLAPFVSLFYLTNDIVTNFACFALSLSSSPNYRPVFHYANSMTAVFGTLLCVFSTLLISPIYAAISICFMMAVFIFLHMQKFPALSGDISQSLVYHQVRKYLLILNEREDIKCWRPQFLLLVSDPLTNLNLIKFANQLKKGGLFVLGHVIKGELDERMFCEYSQQRDSWIDAVQAIKVKAFVEIVVSNKMLDGIFHLIMLSGLGALKPNTVLLGFYEDKGQKPSTELSMKALTACQRKQSFENLQKCQNRDSRDLSIFDYVSALHTIVKTGKNYIIAKGFTNFTCIENNSTIDVYPFTVCHQDQNMRSSLFTLQLSCWLHSHRAWRKTSKLRIIVPVQYSHNELIERDYISRILASYQIHADIIIKTMERNITVSLNEYEIMNRFIVSNTSERTSVIFISMPKAPINSYEYLYYKNLEDLSFKISKPVLILHGVQETSISQI